MGESGVAHAELVVETEGGDGVSDLVETFDADVGGDAGVEGVVEVLPGGGGGCAGDELVGEGGN